MDGNETPGVELAAATDDESLPERLTPVEHGWCIRRAFGSSTWRLAPARAQPLVRILSWVPALGVFGVLTSLCVIVAARGHLILPWYLMAAKGGTLKIGLVGAAGAGLGRLWGRAAAWFLRRTAVVYGRIAGMGPPLHGQLVRIVGTVRSDASFRSAVSGLPAVFVHYEVIPDPGRHRSAHRRRNDVRGIDFLVDTGVGEPVRIHAQDAFITDAPDGKTRKPADLRLVGGAPNALYREARLGPRDEIEAIGVLSYEVDPDGERDHPRDLPRRLTLRGTRRFPLLLRKVS
jgi:hypothetical protein